LWILCFKNLINNALKYADDKKMIIKCFDNKISFINKGSKLPVDISKNIKKWKIDKNKRHKSSTGYGFGLFIIKKIVLLNNYHLNYIYQNNHIVLTITDLDLKNHLRF
jgi:two-component system OmpR family sensor kinase